MYLLILRFEGRNLCMLNEGEVLGEEEEEKEEGEEGEGKIYGSP